MVQIMPLFSDHVYLSEREADTRSYLLEETNVD